MSDQNFKFTPEQMKAARAAKTPEELVSFAKKQGVKVSKEQAERFLNPRVSELADEELGNVNGGCSDLPPYDPEEYF